MGNAVAVEVIEQSVQKTAIQLAMENGELKRLDLSLLFPSPTNPRKHFDAKAMAELTASVKESGVLQPIIVRRVSDTYEIVAGERRFRAATAAGLDAIPALVCDLTDQQVRSIQHIENIQREDVHPLDQSLGFQELIETEHLSVPALAEIIGKPGKAGIVYVYQSLQLLKLIPKAQEAFLADRIEHGHALELSRLQPKVQAEGLKLCSDKHHPMTVRQLRAWIEDHVHLDLDAAPFALDDAELVPPAGACTRCEKRTGTQPALFPDVRAKNTCTDRVCFNEKIIAFIDRKKDDHAEKGEALLELSARYNSSSQSKRQHEAVLTREQWREVNQRNRCEFTRAGLVIEGENVGHLIHVCAQQDCPVHFAENVRRKPDPKVRAAKVAAKREARAKSEACTSAIGKVVASVKSLDHDDLRLIAESFISEFWYENLKKIVKRRSWEVKESKLYGGKDYTETARSHLKAMEPREVAGFLMELALTGRYNSHDDKLSAALKRYGVDLKKLECDTLAELNAKVKDKPAKGKTKKEVKAK